MFKQMRILRPFGLALVLAIGFGVVFGLVVAWGISIWKGLARERVGINENLCVRDNGTPLITRVAYDNYQQTVTYHALDGKEVPAPKEGDGSLGGPILAGPGGQVSFPLRGIARIRLFNDGLPAGNFWYFIHDGARDGHGYFVGYDGKSRLRVGFIGREGFRSDQPPIEQWFAMDGVKLANNSAFPFYGDPSFWYGTYPPEPGKELAVWKLLMISGSQFLEVDLRSTSVRTLMQSADLVSVGSLARDWTSRAAGEKEPHAHQQRHLAVRTADRVLVFEAPGKQLTAYQLPEEYRNRNITLYELDPAHALLITSHALADRRTREELSWIDTFGKVLRRAEVTLGEADEHYQGDQAWAAAMVVPAPVVLAGFAMSGPPLEYLRAELDANYSAALARSLAVCWPALLVVTLLAATLAWCCYLRNQRYYQPASGAWFVFVLLTGVPGLVGYLFHRRWPVLEKCPACGHDVPRDREACAKCGAAFPAPEPKGCEVFA